MPVHRIKTLPTTVLNVAQINVNKSRPALAAALQIAWRNSQHVKTVQGLPKNITQFCPGLAHWHFSSHSVEPKAGIYVAKDFLQNPPEISYTSEDFVVITLVLPQTSFNSVSFYRTPTKSPLDFSRDLQTLSDKIAFSSSVISGDFNAHSYAWDTRSDHYGDTLSDFASDDLTVTNVPQDTTFQNSILIKSVIDLILVSDVVVLNCLRAQVRKTDDWTVSSDHFMVTCSVPARVLPKRTIDSRAAFCCLKANWDQLYTDAAQVSENLISASSAAEHGLESTAQLLQASLVASMDKNIPRHTQKIYQPRWNQRVDDARHKAQRFYRIFKIQHTQVSFLNYKKAQTEARHEIRSAKREFYRRNLQELSPLDAWKKFDTQCNPAQPRTIEPLVDLSGTLVSDPK